MDYFRLVVRAAGVVLILLAVVALPSAMEGIMMLVVNLAYCDPSPGPDALGKAYRLALNAAISKSLGAIIRVVLYAIVARNFLTTQSVVNWFGRRRDADRDREPHR